MGSMKGIAMGSPMDQHKGLQNVQLGEAHGGQHHKQHERQLGRSMMGSLKGSLAQA